MAEMLRNPIDRILHEARRVGREHCWPLSASADVVDSLGSLGQAVLGYELWSFEDAGAPTVRRVSEFSIDLGRPWGEVVAASVAAAKGGLSIAEGRDVWVQLTWVSEAEVDSAVISND